MKRAIAYIRVSSREQGNSQFGLNSQSAEIEGYAKGAGYSVMKILREVASAKGASLRARPVLQEAISIAKRESIPLIVSRLDRISRDADELEEIVSRSGIEVISVRDWPEFTVILKARAARIKRETEMLSERTRKGLARAKQRGAKFGNPVNLPEAQALGNLASRRAAEKRRKELEPAIAEIRSQGAKTGEEIAKALNEAGWRTPRGRLWSDANLRRILRRIDSDLDSAKQRAKEDPNWGIF
jgi:DNA invertase Pin-like site-specific DNA recombinase